MASRAYNIPNLLTYARILAVPLIEIGFEKLPKLAGKKFFKNRSPPVKGLISHFWLQVDTEKPVTDSLPLNHHRAEGVTEQGTTGGNNLLARKKWPLE